MPSQSAAESVRFLPFEGRDLTSRRRTGDLGEEER